MGEIMPRSTERVSPLAGIKTKQEREQEREQETPLPAASRNQPGDENDREKATEQVTAYFTPSQFDRIDELQRAHRKRTGKRITVNALLRRLVENATVEDTLA
jgi:hypothetical protein